MSLGFTRYSVQTELANANFRREVAVNVADNKRTLTVSVKDILGLMFFAFYLTAGITHFTDTEWHVTLVPPALGNAAFWVYFTGVIELLLAPAMLYRPARVYAGRFSALFLVAVYPANIYMWQNGLPLSDGYVLSDGEHVLRLLFQIALIAASLWLGFQICNAADFKWSCTC